MTSVPPDGSTSARRSPGSPAPSTVPGTQLVLRKLLLVGLTEQMWSRGVKVGLGILPVLLCPWLSVCFKKVTSPSLDLRLPICCTYRCTCIDLSHRFSLCATEAGERAWSEYLHLISAVKPPLPLPTPHTHLCWVLSTSPEGTHLHFLCPVPDPHHPGTPSPLSSLRLLGIEEPRAPNLESGSFHFGQDFSLAAGHGGHGLWGW